MSTISASRQKQSKRDEVFYSTLLLLLLLLLLLVNADPSIANSPKN